MRHCCAADKHKHLQRIQQEICANGWVPLLPRLPRQPHIQVAGASSAARAAYNDVPPVPVSVLVAPCALMAHVVACEAAWSCIGNLKQERKSTMWLHCGISR